MLTNYQNFDTIFPTVTNRLLKNHIIVIRYSIKMRVKMKNLSENDVNYVENMCADLVKSLKICLNYDDYIYQMPERARFKRLRVELGKKLMEIQKKIYQGANKI